MPSRPPSTALLVLAVTMSCSGQEPSTMTPEPVAAPVPPAVQAAHAQRVQQAEVRGRQLADALAQRTQQLAANQQFEWRTCVQASCYPAQDQCMREAATQMAATSGQTALQADFDLRVTCTERYLGCAQGCLQRVGPPAESSPEPEPTEPAPEPPLQKPVPEAAPASPSPAG